MKKLFFISMFAILASSFTFAAAKGTGGGNGNGGKDKIGGYIGSPFGLSYSHEFNDLVEFDLVAGYSGLWSYHSLDVQIGALFTVFDPVISGLGDQHCPLSLGPVLGGSINFIRYPYLEGFELKTKTLLGGSIYLLLPVRWEINFGNIPAFNLFIDWSPLGLSVNFHPDRDPYVYYATRFGIGLRYRIPE